MSNKPGGCFTWSMAEFPVQRASWLQNFRAGMRRESDWTSSNWASGSLLRQQRDRRVRVRSYCTVTTQFTLCWVEIFNVLHKYSYNKKKTVIKKKLKSFFFLTSRPALSYPSPRPPPVAPPSAQDSCTLGQRWSACWNQSPPACSCAAISDTPYVQ